MQSTKFLFLLVIVLNGSMGPVMRVI